MLGAFESRTQTVSQPGHIMPCTSLWVWLSLCPECPVDEHPPAKSRPKPRPPASTVANKTFIIRVPFGCIGSVWPAWCIHQAQPIEFLHRDQLITMRSTYLNGPIGAQSSMRVKFFESFAHCPIRFVVVLPSPRCCTAHMLILAPRASAFRRANLLKPFTELRIQMQHIFAVQGHVIIADDNNHQLGCCLDRMIDHAGYQAS